jgi:hypothetical protein
MQFKQLPTIQTRAIRYEQRREMMRRMVPEIYDPPEGWRFGFPKVWPVGLRRTSANLAAQLKADGYPASAIPVALDHTRFIGKFEMLTYDKWMEEIDAILESEWGVVQAELADWLSHDAYENQLTPEQAAIECLRQIGWEPKETEVIDEW